MDMEKKITADMRIAQLALTFPCLHNAPGVMPFDAIKLLKWASTVASHGERIAARFLLSVWNSSTDWGDVARERGFGSDFKRFDLFEAMHCFDAEHLAAMQAWIKRPFFP